MNKSSKYSLYIGAGIVWTLLVASICFVVMNHRNDPSSVAQNSLMAYVDNPESIKIIKVSKPDSIYGRNYVNDKEKMEIGKAMMAYNNKLMESTNNFEEFDLNDTKTGDMMARQMLTMNTLRSVISNPFAHTDKAKKQAFSGWKVKIEYTGVSEHGYRYHSQYWAILDKNATCVIRSFEIPLL